MPVPRKYPQEESNLYGQLRRLVFYPLNYGGKLVPTYQIGF